MCGHFIKELSWLDSSVLAKLAAICKVSGAKLTPECIANVGVKTMRQEVLPSREITEISMARTKIGLLCCWLLGAIDKCLWHPFAYLSHSACRHLEGYFTADGAAACGGVAHKCLEVVRRVVLGSTHQPR